MDRSKQGVFFEERFLDKHAGAIIADPAVAIVELVANCWDAYATSVEIIWPVRTEGVPLSIIDNGKGMTAAEFKKRWKTIDYDRSKDETNSPAPPDYMKGYPPRRPYGRNGRGRHAAFCFSDPYTVRTWRDGTELLYEVRRGSGEQPFEHTLLRTTKNVEGHGTQILATASEGVNLSADRAREIVGTRFLADPSFSVSIDGKMVTFDDVPDASLQTTDVDVPGYGTAHIVLIDGQKPDRTTRQHGIAWRVNKRLVGNCDWSGFDHERVLDGRTSDAKRFTCIVSADFLDYSVLSDWTAFDPTSQAWQSTRPVVHSKLKELLGAFSAERRREAKEAVKESLIQTVRRLPPVGRDRWNQFVDEVVDNCPSISTEEIGQVAEILANLEVSTSRYGLLSKLHDLPPGDLDALYEILDDWTVRLAKDALDEIQTRLKLIDDLDQKLRDEKMDEVGDLQPIFERSLWVFGPEFESLEFTSNKGMTEVIRKIFGSDITGSRQRPDFVMLPDGSVGLYSRDAHDLGHEVDGVSRLVITEIKRPGISIGAEQKGQAWRYVKELIEAGLVTEAATVTCYVLGSKVDPSESGHRTEWNQRVTIIPMTYNTFIRRAEKRMLGLREKLSEAPFLREHGISGTAFLELPQRAQMELIPK